MPSFKKTRDMLFYSYYKKHITANQLLILLEENTSHNPEFSYCRPNKFDLQTVPEPECLSNFRFAKTDIPILAEVLGLPDIFRCHQRTTVEKLEGFCILLRRLAFSCQYGDMIPMFNWPAPELSMIANEVLDFIFENHNHRLTQGDERLLSPANLQIYADAIDRKGAALENCFGFVDGTVRPVRRPNKHQRIVYNCYKRVHSLKFQSVT